MDINGFAITRNSTILEIAEALGRGESCTISVRPLKGIDGKISKVELSVTIQQLV